MNTSTTLLEYGKRPPSWKRIRLGIFVAISSAVLIAPLVWFRDAIFDRLEVTYLQYQCSLHVEPKDVVAYEEDPAKSNLLMSRVGYKVVDTGKVVRVYEPWSRLADAMGLDGETAIFCHSRRSPGGKERLVVISHHLMATVVEMGGILGKPRRVWRKGIPYDVEYPVLDWNSNRRLRLYAGQPDPGDESHFTIRYEIEGQQGTIDAWLEDDDGVRLRALDGPAKQSEEAYLVMDQARDRLVQEYKDRFSSLPRPLAPNEVSDDFDPANPPGRPLTGEERRRIAVYRMNQKDGDIRKQNPKQ